MFTLETVTGGKAGATKIQESKRGCLELERMLTMGVGEGGCGFLEQTQLKPTPTPTPYPVGNSLGGISCLRPIQIPTRPCLPLGKAWNKQIILSGGEHLF